MRLGCGRIWVEIGSKDSAGSLGRGAGEWPREGPSLRVVLCGSNGSVCALAGCLGLAGLGWPASAPRDAPTALRHIKSVRGRGGGRLFI